MADHNRHASRFQALGDFRYEIRRFLNFSEQAARKAGIEPHQHQALLAIKSLPEEKGPTIGMLAERLQVQHHTAVELTDRLKQKGLVRKVRSELDHRQVLLELTAQGERLLQTLSRAHRAELRTAAPKLIRALRATVRSEGTRTKSRRAAAKTRKLI
jgi:DNA-binding MarR family transcriptional regulator